MCGGHKASWEMKYTKSNAKFNFVIKKLSIDNAIKKYGIYAKFGKIEEFDISKKHRIIQPVYIRGKKGNSIRTEIKLQGHLDFNEKKEYIYFSQVAGRIKDLDKIITKLEQLFKIRIRRF